MDANEVSNELLAVGEKIRSKGWRSASVDIYVQYLAVFDIPPGPNSPMISYRPSISATPHRLDGSFFGNGGGQQYVHDAYDIKSLDDAIAKLHEAADQMPMMADEAKRIDGAKEKLTESERRLLGVR